MVSVGGAAAESDRGGRAAARGDDVGGGVDPDVVELDEEIARLDTCLLGAGAGVDLVDEDASGGRRGRGRVHAEEGERVLPLLGARVEERAAGGRRTNVEGGGVEGRDDGRGARRRGGEGDLDVAVEGGVARALADPAEELLERLGEVDLDLGGRGGGAVRRDLGGGRALAGAVELAAEGDVGLLSLGERGADQLDLVAALDLARGEVEDLDELGADVALTAGSAPSERSARSARRSGSTRGGRRIRFCL